VQASGPYGIEINKYNVLSFSRVTTSALRLEITMQKDWSAGVQEWKVK
jgi:hypothetical protein